MVDEDFMRLAISKARNGIKHGQTPFGACIVSDGEVISCAHNVVWATKDITAHAEVQAIRQACRMLGRIDLRGCVLYTTCEPCAMCFGACHWARIDRIVFGASIQDARYVGFNELIISAQTICGLGESCIEVVGGILSEETIELFDEWRSAGYSSAY